MKKAIEALEALPDEKQDTLAGFLLFKLQEDRLWEQTSIKYADKLRKLADEAMEEFRTGQTSELDPEKL